MMSEWAQAAIIAIANVDPAATDAERERIRVAMQGTRPHGATVRITAAAKLLGVHRNTIYNWIKCGRLTPVTGADGKTIGVTETSLAKV